MLDHKLSSTKPLIVFELANNHQGSERHGQRIIDALAECGMPYRSAFDFAVKFQFRNLDTFIDPASDACANKYIPRFRSTQLTESQFGKLLESARACGFLVATTPFDEDSVDQALRLNISTLKIASCSAREWPLLDKACKAASNLVVSTAGLAIDKIDALYSYLRHECHGEFTLLHCVGIYPAPLESLNLETIRRFVLRYPRARIGYSGHENPSNHQASVLALALGARVFERHVGVATPDYSLNNYSLSPSDVAEWLRLMYDAILMLGGAKSLTYTNVDEDKTLNALRRGVFAKSDILPDQEITPDLVQFRFPLRERQIDVATFASIYNRSVANSNICAGEAITFDNALMSTDSRSETLDKYVQRIRGIAAEAKVGIADGEFLEISHHFGMERLWKYGCCIVNVLNRAYCKKIILMTEGQQHPEQYHDKKEETFKIISGVVELKLDQMSHVLKPGDIFLIPVRAKHSFVAKTDAVIEEISTTSFAEDSFYTDPRIASKPRTARKSIVHNFVRSD